MTDWVRLWHDMPTDPKWRVIARKSGQPLPCVIAVFTFMLTNASGNSAERGALSAWDNEDVAAALDMDADQVASIISSMQGKVLDGQRLTGWERRQPKREDGTAFERKAAWKERKATERNASERNGTQRDAPETDAETDADAERKKDAAKAAVDPVKVMFDQGRAMLVRTGTTEARAGSMLGKWRRDYGDGAVMEVITDPRAERASVPLEWIVKALRSRGDHAKIASGRASIEATAPCL